MIRTAALVAFAAAPLAAQQPAARDSGAFVVMLGADTIAVERYVRTPGRLEGEMLLRTPATVHRRWVAEIGAGERVTRFTYDARRLAGGTAPTHAELTFAADAVTAAVRAGGRDTTLRVAAAGAQPYVHFSYSVMEQLLRAAGQPAAGDSVVLPVLSVGAARPTPAVVRRLGRDSALLAVFDTNPYRMQVDAAGRILGLRGDATTQKVVVRRVPAVDMAAVGRAWAALDSAGAAMGVLSPLDSATGLVGGAEVAVTYSRPSLRGRALLGLLVPYDAPWRTGANAATILRTSHDLVIGGTRVPAGRYSLWTIVGRTGAQLVVNRQTGQWGTEYDPAHDLARIPLTMTSGHPVREQFTFAIEPDRIVYAWGDVEFEVSVRQP